MHDLGLIAKTRLVDGVERKGFEMYVGGGLGAVPQLAKLFDEFVPENKEGINLIYDWLSQCNVFINPKSKI